MESNQPTDAELGIDIAALSAEALMSGASQFLPEAIKVLREQRLREFNADAERVRLVEQGLVQAQNLTINVRRDRPPYFAR